MTLNANVCWDQGLPAAMYSACIEMCVGKRKSKGIVNHKDIMRCELLIRRHTVLC